MSKLFQIFCKKGNDRKSCNFRKIDNQLTCVNCSFAGFLKRERQINPKQDNSKNEQ